MDDAGHLLREGLGELEVPDAGRAAGLLVAYMDELERWNPRFGLVKYEGRRELVVKHVLDSLSAWRHVGAAAGESGGAVLDVGSGAGLPGIPLAIALPDLSFTLVERMARRASFLKTCILLLRLQRVSVLAQDLRQLGGRHGVVTFRAVAPLDRFLSESAQASLRWRTVLAYKGRKEKAEEELRAVRALLPSVSAEIVPLRTPFLGEERCLVCLRAHQE